MFQAFEPIELLARNHIIWESVAWPGYEHLCIEAWSGDGGYNVDGLVVAVLSDRPSRIWYRIEIDDSWIFKSLSISVTDEISEFDDGPLDLDGDRLELVRTPNGHWDHDYAGSAVNLSACTDIDIAITPFTNTLPIRRLELDVGEAAEIDVVYVTVPDLTLAPASQRYTRLTERLYRFESLASGFIADITVDEHGLVTDYPELFRRVWPD